MNIGNNFKRALNYIYGSRNYIYSMVIIFVIAGLFGYFNASKLGMLDEIIKKIIERTEGLSGIGLIGFIFWNNLQSAFFGFLYGVILGIFSIFTALANGVMIGYVMEKAVSSMGFMQTLKLLPHGIFELPAIFIALGIGFRFGMFIFSKHKMKDFRKGFFEGLNVFVFIIIPLLLIAAIIEGSLIALFK